MNSVEHLILSYNILDTLSVDSIASTSNLSNLKQLDLCGTKIGFENMNHLLSSDLYRTLEILDVRSCDIPSANLCKLNFENWSHVEIYF